MLPSELSDSYAAMLARIQNSTRYPHPVRNLGMRVLMWLHLATRPLYLKVLQHALAVVLEEGEHGNVDLDVNQIPTQKRLLDCCFGLVIVDEETMTVRFVHYTLEEYFKHDNHGTTYFPDHHALAAQICLTYLTSFILLDFMGFLPFVPKASSTIFSFLWAFLEDYPLTRRLPGHYLCSKCACCTTFIPEQKTLFCFSPSPSLSYLHG